METFIIRDFYNLPANEIPRKIPIKNLGWLIRKMRKYPPDRLTFWRMGTITTETNVLIALFPDGDYYQTNYASEDVYRDIFKRWVPLTTFKGKEMNHENLHKH